MPLPRASSVVGPLLAAAAVAVLAACGGGSSSASKANTTGSGAAVTSTIKATKGGDFCKQVVAAYNRLVNVPGGASATPDELRRQVEDSLKADQDAIDGAPDAVKPDLQIIQDAARSFSAGLAKADYDVTRLGQDFTTAASVFNTPAFQQAAVHVQTYVKDHCGIDLGATSTTTP